MKRSGRIRTKPSPRREAETEALATAREAVFARSRLRCEVCGGRASDYSHRRTRAVRGEHQHCPCNALAACRTCHRRMHDGPEAARFRGWHVSSAEAEPGSVPVYLPFRQGWFLLGCDGSMSRTEVPVDDGA